tara:strand:+ start:3720 stop:4184 length:465 start_codon:yes stop_codon:yes gene_type:complete
MNYEDAQKLILAYINASVLQITNELETTITTMRIAGASNKAIKEYLEYDLKNRGRIFGTFTNSVTNNVAIGITGASQIAQMLAYERAGVKEYVWVAVSKNPCFQCKGRAGRIETKERWIAAGLPRSGFSICRGNCKCHIEPSNYKGDTTVLLDE